MAEPLVLVLVLVLVVVLLLVVDQSALAEEAAAEGCAGRAALK